MKKELLPRAVIGAVWRENSLHKKVYTFKEKIKSIKDIYRYLFKEK